MAAYFLWHNRLLDAEKMPKSLSKALATMAPYHPELVVFDEHARALEGSSGSGDPSASQSDTPCLRAEARR